MDLSTIQFKNLSQPLENDVDDIYNVMFGLKSTNNSCSKINSQDLLSQLLCNPPEPETFSSLLFLYQRCKGTPVRQSIITLISKIFCNIIKNRNEQSISKTHIKKGLKKNANFSVEDFILNQNSTFISSNSKSIVERIFQDEPVEEINEPSIPLSINDLQITKSYISNQIIREIFNILPHLIKISSHDEMKQLYMLVSLVIENIPPEQISIQNSAIFSAYQILQLNETKELDDTDSITFSQIFLISLFNVNKNYIFNNDFKDYVISFAGKFIPFASLAATFDLKDHSLNSILQEFWVFINIISKGNPFSVFSNYFEEIVQLSSKLNPLIPNSDYTDIKNFINYSDPSFYISDILQFSDNSLWKYVSVDEIANLICSNITTISRQAILSLQPKEAIFFLSAFNLERARSYSGYFTPFLQYLNCSWSPPLMQLFNSLTDFVFSLYIKSKFSQKNSLESFKVGALILNSLGGKYPSLQPLMEKLGIPFLAANPHILYNFIPLTAFLNCLTDQLQIKYLNYLKPIFEFAIRDSPYLFSAALIKSLYDLSNTKTKIQENFKENKTVLNSNFKQYSNLPNSDAPKISSEAIANQESDNVIRANSRKVSVFPIHILFSFLSSDFVDSFYNLYHQFVFNMGARTLQTSEPNSQLIRTICSFSSLIQEKSFTNSRPEHDIHFSDMKEKSINTAENHDIECYLYQNADKLFVDADLEIRLHCWSFIVMGSTKYNLSFFRILAQKINELTVSNSGIFTSEETYSKNYIHNSVKFNREKIKKAIDLQESAFIFILSFINNDEVLEIIKQIIAPIFSKRFMDDPKALRALIPLACIEAHLIISHFQSSSTNCDYPHPNLVLLLFRTLLCIISQKDIPNVYRYIRKRPEIRRTFSKLLQILPLISKNLKPNNPNIIPTAKILSQALHSLQNHYDKIINDIPFNDLELSFPFLLYILSEEFMCFSLFINPSDPHIEEKGFIASNDIKGKPGLDSLIKIAFNIYPSSLYSISITLQCQNEIISYIKQNSKINGYPYIFQNAKFASLLNQCDSSWLTFTRHNTRYFSSQTSISDSQALANLSKGFLLNKESASYAISSLENSTDDELIEMIPQLVQLLRYDPCKLLWKFLKHKARKSDKFLTYFNWNLTQEIERSTLPTDPLPIILVELKGKIMKDLSPVAEEHFFHEMSFIEDMTKISEQLLPLPIPDRKDALVQLINKMKISNDLFVPSNSHQRIVSIIPNKCIPLKSHSRVPILVRFRIRTDKSLQSDNSIGESESRMTEKRASMDDLKNAVEEQSSACIFKIKDDVRMDAMITQLFRKCQQIFKDSGIDVYLKPYHVFATGDQRGVIECIENAQSRHDMGMNGGEDLFTYFSRKFGMPGTLSFEKARDNFVRSMAACSIVCYLFQIKDRHNANIMFDEEGHVLHIDFGFIFEISPGGNMHFEKAEFKFNHEMNVLIGEKIQLFKDLMIQCILAIRERYDEVEAIVSTMMEAGFPCFTPDSLVHLRERVFMEKSAVFIESGMNEKINGSIEAITTTYYDKFQASSNHIFYI